MIGARMPWGAAPNHKGRQDHEAGRAPGEKSN
jgi:hypothetical protein